MVDALFKDINEMLLRLFYLYNNSAKKFAQLTEIVNEQEIAYHYQKGGNVPFLQTGNLMDYSQEKGYAENS